jgi:hypothetical protein
MTKRIAPPASSAAGPAAGPGADQAEAPSAPGGDAGRPPGAGRRRGGFRAHILTAGGGYRRLGRYGTAEAAAAAYRAAATRPRGEAPGGGGFDVFGRAAAGDAT